MEADSRRRDSGVIPETTLKIVQFSFMESVDRIPSGAEARIIIDPSGMAKAMPFQDY